LKGDFFAALIANRPEAWHHENEILTLRAGVGSFAGTIGASVRTGDVIGTARSAKTSLSISGLKSGINASDRVYAVLSGINTLMCRPGSTGAVR